MQKQQVSPNGEGKPTPLPKVSKAPGESFSLVAFLQGTKEELSKVVWPTRQQLIAESVSVLLMVSLSALIIYLIDNLFNWAASKVFG
ncbi:MAG: preprotein translocase subunit SecE [Prochlorotrichaceae cyanobacterium]|jgi:preprotein translocase subunit SecE